MARTSSWTYDNQYRETLQALEHAGYSLRGQPRNHSRGQDGIIREDATAPIRDDYTAEQKPFLQVYESSTEHESPLDSKSAFKRLRGWRHGVRWCAVGMGLVMTLNVVLVVVASTKYRDGMSQGIGVLYQGSCKLVERWLVALHLLINVLSSLALAASNYVMQCLSSPTRAEINRAHSKGKRLDIGVSSARNVMGGVSWDRTLAWVLLAVTSMPIHLLYNSVVFKTSSSMQYGILVATRSFIDAGDIVTLNDILPADCGPMPNGVIGQNQVDYWTPFFPDRNDLLYWQQYFTSDAVEELSVEECIGILDKPIVADRRAALLSVSLVGTQMHTENLTYLDMGATDWSTTYYKWTQGFWIHNCGAYSTAPNENGNDLTFNIMAGWNHGPGNAVACDPTCTTWKANSCIISKPEGQCKLQYTLSLLAVVIVCNLIKMTVMIWVLLSHTQPTLVTFGDAVASFLRQPDPVTLGKCLQGKACILRAGTGTLPTAANLRRKRWQTAVSKKRWISTILLCIAGIATPTGLLVIAQRNISSDQTSIFDSGFNEAVNADFTIGFGNGVKEIAGAGGLLEMILLVNSPQLICSCLYFALNALWTSMLLASEWSSYHLDKKPLRTSRPVGQQRSTYWLQLPLRYSIPILSIFAVLHWMVSQSLFLVRIEKFDAKGHALNTVASQTSSAGFSTLSIFISIMIGAVILLTTVAFGLLRRFRSPMPVAGSSSLAIAAACHPPYNDSDAALRPISWGDVSEETSDVGHCCFTSRPVRALQHNSAYA